MDHSAIEPIVIVDEDEVILVDDESEDEIEILGYGLSSISTSPSTTSWSSKLRSNNSLRSHQRQDRISTPDKPAVVSLPYIHKRPVAFIPLSNPVGSTQAARDFSEDSTVVSIANRILSRPRTLSVEPSPRDPSSLSNTPKPPIGEFGFSPSNQHMNIEDSAFKDADLQSLNVALESGQRGRNGSDLLATRGLDFEKNSLTCDGLIDLDELENFDDLWNDEENLQLLRVEEGKNSQYRWKSSKIAIAKRNPPISGHFIRLQSFRCQNNFIRSTQTVELLDGDFLLVTDIIQDSNLGTVTLRGQRLQRCRSMNGLLERKLNELCFYQEVDLDDPRPPQEQSAVEVSVDTVQGLRLVRNTNQVFPLCRNLDLDKYGSQNDASAGGGLTVRWKYTCTYASATDRWHNNPNERALEFLREEESTREFKISEIAKRFGWRGETVPGGAYRPELEIGKHLIGDTRKESIISIASSSAESELGVMIVDSPRAASSAIRSVTERSQLTLSSANGIKRKGSSKEVTPNTLREKSKKVRLDNGDEVEITRHKLSELRVEDRQFVSHDKCYVDLTVAPLSSQQIPSDRKDIASSLSSQHSSATKIPPPLTDLFSSDLATPSPTGAIRCDSISTKATKSPVIRCPGQMLTYGDAFCGAGGATRGAAMAGLRVFWGFDHWSHACLTWRTNFQQAECYELSSQDFVDRAQGSKYRKPVDMKVDILHLSPPCQYFSPAHTVDCPNDEMNIASLYAVGPIIKVARPRIVTLEQTFGIVAVRFRKYFNSLIQMFTALSFSIRWAIVPLAQWGLPQRRYRLIIIAACPGEVLPAIPSATHSDTSLSPNLPPFRTVNDTLSQNSLDAPDDDLASLVFPSNKRLQSWDGNAILPRAMTTSGGQNYHPSGKRDFTIREYAALQGFPPNHVFMGSYVKKQIGNAVPPVIAKVLFDSIKKQLDLADMVVEMKETMVID